MGVQLFGVVDVINLRLKENGWVIMICFRPVSH